MRARTRVTKGPGTKDAGLAMVFKLLEAAEGRWRAVNGPHLVALVRAGVRFDKGVMVANALTRSVRSPRDHARAPSTTLDDSSETIRRPH